MPPIAPTTSPRPLVTPSWGMSIISVPSSLNASYGYVPGRNIAINTLGPSAGGAVNLANEGAGTGLVYDSFENGTYYFRTLQADLATANAGIVVTTDVPNKVVDIGNSMTGANLGAGQPVFVSKTRQASCSSTACAQGRTS